MIVCHECLSDVCNLGNPCLHLLLDILIHEEENVLLAIDSRHRIWRSFKNECRPSQDLNNALVILERAGYLISTEISEHLVGVSINWDRADYDDENDIICWCGREVLE